MTRKPKSAAKPGSGKKPKPAPPPDGVDEAGRGSFPASDPPPWTLGRKTGKD